MKRNWRRLKSATASLVTVALLSTAAPATGRAQAKPEDKGSGGQAENKSTKHRSRKGAYVLTLAGAGVIAAGAYLIASQPPYQCAEQCVVGAPCPLCPVFRSDKKVGGALFIGIGSVMTVGGLLLMRHPKDQPASQPHSGSAALLPVSSRRFSVEHGGNSRAQLGASPTFNIGHFIGAKGKYQAGIPQARQFVLRTPDLTATPRANPD
jgi:hypothetical protein